MMTARSPRSARRGDSAGVDRGAIRPVGQTSAGAGASPTNPLTLAGRQVHFVGIGGAALSGLARIALAEGARVSGSDLQESTVTNRLRADGVTVYIGHAATNLGDADLVVVSSAVPSTNPELVEARRRGLLVLKRHEFVGQLMAGHIGVGVAGTHGKTTTTSLLALILEDAALSPTFLIGGEPRDLGASARQGSGLHFVVEADEYDRAFLHMPCDVAVVTSIELDHPDIYPTVDDMLAAYRQFIGLIPRSGTLVANWDDARVRDMVKGLRGADSPIIVTYGVAHSGQWWAAELMPRADGGHDFTVWRMGRNLGRFSVRLPGLHNVSNALGALAAAERLGISMESARASLARFQGAARRFDVKGERNGVTIVDDYAHHPSEIRATLAAARGRYPGRPLWAVFQPHTYSRTANLLGEFARAFRDADHVLVVDIFAARETDTLGVSSQDVVGRMAHPDARYVGSLDAAAAVIAEEAQPGDVALTLGAGDVWKVAESLVK